MPLASGTTVAPLGGAETIATVAGSMPPAAVSLARTPMFTATPLAVDAVSLTATGGVGRVTTLIGMVSEPLLEECTVTEIGGMVVAGIALTSVPVASRVFGAANCGTVRVGRGSRLSRESALIVRFLVAGL